MTPLSVRDRFWELPLESLDRKEWESLCDGCARCCLKKLQEDTEEPDGPDEPAKTKETGSSGKARSTGGQLWYTRVVCRYLDQQKCQCTAYGSRQVLVPDCLVLDMTVLKKALHWIPDTCAYKLRYLNKPLPSWHPLLTGSRLAMQQAGINVTGRVISEEYVHEDGLEEHIIRWVKA
jgi:uncharacterized cysteine cluster protein YcgN (CxxCxxCC family)